MSPLTPPPASEGRAADCLPLWGDTAARPRTFGMPVCEFAAGHLSKASWMEFCGSCGLLGAFWGVLGSLFEPPGALLGASWRLLGRLGRVLGPLGRLLSRLGSNPKRHQDDMPKKVNFQTPKRRVTLQHGGAFGKPKSTKIGPNTSPKLRRFSRAKAIAFKSL